MSKEEYADETEKYVSCYRKGKKEEIERILKFIDTKILETKSLKAYKEAILNIKKYPKTYHECIGRLNAFKEMKEELEKSMTTIPNYKKYMQKKYYVHGRCNYCDSLNTLWNKNELQYRCYDCGQTFEHYGE